MERRGLCASLTWLVLGSLAGACGAPSSEPLAVPAAPADITFVAQRFVAAPVAPTKVVRRVARPRAAPAAVEPEIDIGTDTEEVTLPWSLSESAFASIVAGWNGLSTCVRTARATAGGALRVAFAIESDGAVTSARAIDTSNALARSIAPCVERKARLLRFPAFESDEVVERVAKFVF